ncbi:YSC84-related protein [Poseidonocella sedimentorum]|uniref:Las17-binding protein actin regulator n=1 Tax=Poseidonocella sedimentorum TaxID=871652 RepID=A0A1I6E7S0_9RHOB|nr:YSC84-related protein [Poseidonocella sedimentorum]SFR13793.1 Las17-binding protein actin regulator [Poseidonocella sedimentorum]
MSSLSRRMFTLGLAASTGALAACNNGIGSQGAATIDARVDSTLNYLYTTYPGTRDLAAKSAGQLVMPLVTEVGLGIGGSFGRGALRVDGATVDYYSAAAANIGVQVGAQQYAHVLFFMTQEALMDFRRSAGWAAGADLEYVVSDRGETLRADTNTATSPVIAVVFGQAGLKLGATLEGSKYTRIIP